MRVVRFVGRQRCGDPGYQRLLGGGAGAVVDAVSKAANVTLRFSRDEHPVEVRLAPTPRDLLDLAVLVYIADELVARASAPDRWTRRFELVVPVRSPDLWARASPLLEETLRFLAGDDISFSWLPREQMPGFGSHRKKLPGRFDTVCLFSGGIDSLLGAWRALTSGHRVILVGHQAEGITASVQTKLAGALRARFPGAVTHIQCRAARALREQPTFPLPEKCEDSHRPRSFLFLGVAAAIAAATGIDRIWIPENGLIALNAPLQSSRVGTLSTRTAHPRFLDLFRRLIGALGVFGGAVQNPFLYLSKTDMLRDLPEDVRALLPMTVSCAHAGHVRWEGARGTYHCGYCVPCLYRRVAMIEAGLTERYVHDVFADLASLTPHKQRDFRALVRFARRVVAMREVERQMLVMSHGAFSAALSQTIGVEAVADLSPWSAMLQRWAVDFLRKIETQGSAATLRALDMATPPLPGRS